MLAQANQSQQAVLPLGMMPPQSAAPYMAPTSNTMERLMPADQAMRSDMVPVAEDVVTQVPGVMPIVSPMSVEVVHTSRPTQGTPKFEQLRQLKKELDQGLLSEAEFADKKSHLLVSHI